MGQDIAFCDSLFVMESKYRVQFMDDRDPFAVAFAEPTRPLSFVFESDCPLVNQIDGLQKQLRAPHDPEDIALQVTGHGIKATFLDLDLSIEEQAEDLGLVQDSRKTVIIVRTKPSVRVHTIIETLLCTKGKDLRKALFALRRIFKEDQDLVQEFVSAEGLSCLISVGRAADQNHQQYILRALGELLLYLDGMYGVMNSPETVQWVYSLVSSKFRLVGKTAMEILLIFVTFSPETGKENAKLTDITNAARLLEAVQVEDSAAGINSPNIILVRGMWSFLLVFFYEGWGHGLVLWTC